MAALTRSRVISAFPIVAICAAFVAGAAAAPSVLPQQSGAVDLLTHAALRIDGASGGYAAGFAVSGAGDVNGDGRVDVLVAEHFASTNGRAGAGAAHVLFGGTSDPTVDLAALGQRGFRIDGAADGDFAEDVSAAGDVNGDGRADVLVGAPRADNNGRSASGSAYVVFGKTSTTAVDLAALGDGGFRIDGAATSNFAGYSVSGVGDLNGDGRADVVVGARLADHNGRDDSGSAYVVFGKASAATVDLAVLGDGGFRIDGAGGVDNAGEAVSGAGDVNGDGRPDVIVGAPVASQSGHPYSGSAYVVFGKASATAVDLAALGDGGFRIDGAASFDDAGVSVSGAGDVNQDGRADVLVGAHGADNNGRSDSGSAYLVFGKASTTAVDLTALAGGGFRIDGQASNDEAGGAVSGAGDVNGDGRPDLLVGAKWAENNGRSSSGSAYVVYGKASTATVDLAALGASGFRIDGASQVHRAGEAVSGLGDWNGDGRPDVLIGAPGADYNGRSGSGSAYAVLGFGEPRLAYNPLEATAGDPTPPHAPSLLERTGTTSFQIAPALPAGLSVDASGTVTGTPRVAQAQTTHTVTMQDLAGQVSAPLVVTIAPDRTRPRLTLLATSPQRALRQKRVLVRASCNEDCTLSAQGTIAILGTSARIPLRPASATRATTATRALSLRLTAAARKRLDRFLDRGRRARATVSVRARDLAGNERKGTRTVGLRR